MLNRRILRTKAFKAVFCYAENPGMTLKETEALLEISCESTRDLYLFLLSIVGPLTDEARSRIESSRNKFSATDQERNPNLKFVNNRIAPLLASDRDFTKLIARKKLSWDQYDALLRNLYESIRTKDYFTSYLENGQSSLEDDAALWCKIFENEFEDNQALEEILEDLSIYWNDDLPYSLGWCCKSLRSIAKGECWNLPALYQSELPGNEAMESDRAFVHSLVRTAYANLDAYCTRVAELTPKWNRDRLCTTDLALIACGLAESKAFPATPFGVIINEYVEISKYYSTPESSAFVNGLLDKILNNRENA